MFRPFRDYNEESNMVTLMMLYERSKHVGDMLF